MPTLFVRHRVADYAAWKQVYDAGDALRKAAGVTSHGVYQSAEDAGDVTIYHEFKTMNEAQRILQNADLKAAMERGGVQGAPEVWITNRVGGG